MRGGGEFLFFVDDRFSDVMMGRKEFMQEICRQQEALKCTKPKLSSSAQKLLSSQNCFVVLLVVVWRFEYLTGVFV